MAQLFATMVFLFLGGTLLASIVTNTIVPLIVGVGSLYLLLPVFNACDKAPKK